MVVILCEVKAMDQIEPSRIESNRIEKSGVV